MTCAVLAAAQAHVAQAQESPRWERSVEIQQDLGMVMKAVLLSRGSAIAFDASDKRVYAIDFRTGKARDVASVGQGPNEYMAAGDIGRASGDTTFLFDKGLQRILLVNEKGIPFHTILLAEYFGQKRAFMMLGQVLHVSPKGTAFVFSLPKVALTTRSLALSDSSYLVKVTVIEESVHADTLAIYKSSAGSIVPGQPTSTEPFPSLDAPGLLQTGRLVVARGKGFHIDIWDSERDSTHFSVPFAPRPVTAEHRKQYSEQLAIARARLEKTLTPEVRERVGPLILGTVSEPRHWPEFFPPFVHTAAFVAEGRFLWLQASTSSMTGTQYYVVDTQLRRTSTVNLPGGVSVLSVLGKEMLVLAPGEGDVPRLQLFVAK